MSDIPRPASVPGKPTFPTVTTGASTPKPGSVSTPGLGNSRATYQTAPRNTGKNPKGKKIS